MAEVQRREINIKVVIGGNQAVGKTNMLLTYTSGSYPGEFIPTVFDNYSVLVMFRNEPVILNLFDTAGQEGYNRFRVLSYNHADAFIVCFSVCRRQTFDAILAGWNPEMRDTRLGMAPDAPLILVGLKSDIRQTGKYLANDYHSNAHPEMNFVKVTEAHDLARKIGAFAYVECSSLQNRNVKKVFDTAIEAYLSIKKPKFKQTKNHSLVHSFKKKMQHTFGKKEKGSKENLNHQEEITKNNNHENTEPKNISTFSKNQPENDKNSTDIFPQKLPFLMQKEIFKLLSSKDICRLCCVNQAFYKTANDNSLWHDIAIKEDQQYDPVTDGDPKKFLVAMHTVWYNDFQIEPIPPSKNYIPYGAMGWNPELY